MNSYMQRATEPELMIDPEQAKAYAEADFNKSHSNILLKFDQLFPDVEIDGLVLDLGCGPGDITFRFAYRFPQARFIGIDGSPAMLDFAEARKQREFEVAAQLNFVESYIPSDSIPTESYQAIISGSFLHHLHDPQVMWNCVKRYGQAGTKVFISDLCRPRSQEIARQIVLENSADEPQVLQDDYYYSLLAAFTPEEIAEQLLIAGLPQLQVHLDGNMYVYGTL